MTEGGSNSNFTLKTRKNGNQRQIKGTQISYVMAYVISAKNRIIAKLDKYEGSNKNHNSDCHAHVKRLHDHSLSEAKLK